jgi:hypothetical protein
LPGSLAALHHDRIAPALPALVEISADDGLDHVELRLRPRAGVQLIASDPHTRGTSFIHELVGEFEAEGRIFGRSQRARGLAVFEYVD